MRDLMNFVDIDGQAAGSIMVGMREMAMVDGNQHPRELEMISLLESDLNGEPGEAVQIDSLDTRELQDAFLKSLALVALVDGALKAEESELIYRYGEQLGRTTEEVAAVLHDVATVMLSAFAGVTIFRDQATQIGRSLGLDDASISDILDSDVPDNDAS
ncbi:MAG: hypothetical protein ACI8S6_005777 [Myxococcota bacterium]|jgi:hypothetical protein